MTEPKTRPGQRPRRRPKRIELTLKTPSAPASFFPATDAESVVVMTIGGIGAIGSNWTAYGHAGRWLLVDAGAGMPPKGVAGLQVVVPDPAALKQMLGRLVAVVVTHAHYDHIGGLPALAPYLPKGTKVYATKFAAECVRSQLERYHLDEHVDIRTFSPNSNLTLKSFTLTPIRVAHSSPEALAFGISTPAGRVLHTGDWRIDEAPNVTWKTDLAAVARFAKGGLAAMVADSTCADRPSPAPSEQTITANFARFLEGRRGLVVTACFSSHVDRVAGMIQAAATAGRTVFVAGRSLLRTLEAARETGILDERHAYETDLRNLESLDPSRAMLICTGTQGEDNAILRRLADDDHSLPALEAGDCVVLSARVIPGNEEEVAVVANAFRQAGIEVFMGEADGLPLHASGHASRPEIEAMLAAASPRLLIPVHGAGHHLAAHVDLARAAGIAECAVPANGRALRVTGKTCEVLGTVELRPMAGVLRNGRLVLKPLEVAVEEAIAAAQRAAAREEARIVRSSQAIREVRAPAPGR